MCGIIISNNDNNYVAIFNGEIYNYKQQYNYTCIVNNIKAYKLYKL